MEKPKNIIDFFGQMLSRREYLIPLIAAQYQFPNHYYPFTAAALLEDLFVDAAINFKNEFHRGIELSRPEKKTEDQIVVDAKGEKGWDYKYEGQNYSHKVGRKVQDIGLLWDATFKLPPDQTYSYPSPMVFALSNYKGKNGVMSVNEKHKLQISPLSSMRNKKLIQDQTISIMRKISGESWRVLDVIEVDSNEVSVHQLAPLRTVWDKLMDHWADGVAANEIEMFVTKSLTPGKRAWLEKDQEVTLHFINLPGIYLFPMSALQNIKVKKNNRGILLPTAKVSELMELALQTHNFVLCPNWYSLYADSRSVDLYQVQRAEYDRLNTAARN